MVVVVVVVGTILPFSLSPHQSPLTLHWSTTLVLPSNILLFSVSETHPTSAVLRHTYPNVKNCRLRSRFLVFSTHGQNLEYCYSKSRISRCAEGVSDWYKFDNTCLRLKNRLSRVAARERGQRRSRWLAGIII